MPAPHRVALKRVYAPVSPDDGRRVLVERLWPRGLRKAEAGVDLWPKEIAPSHALRRYREELRATPASAALVELHRLVQADPATLLFAARDQVRNSAVVLKAVLEEALE
jgi:uncharacterized protein YeaO (DUF488 family)